MQIRSTCLIRFSTCDFHTPPVCVEFVLGKLFVSRIGTPGTLPVFSCIQK
jgi:hypothetical protein